MSVVKVNNVCTSAGPYAPRRLANTFLSHLFWTKVSFLCCHLTLRLWQLSWWLDFKAFYRDLMWCSIPTMSIYYSYCIFQMNPEY